MNYELWHTVPKILCNKAAVLILPRLIKKLEKCYMWKEVSASRLKTWLCIDILKISLKIVLFHSGKKYKRDHPNFPRESGWAPFVPSLTKRIFANPSQGCRKIYQLRKKCLGLVWDPYFLIRYHTVYVRYQYRSSDHKNAQTKIFLVCLARNVKDILCNEKWWEFGRKMGIFRRWLKFLLNKFLSP